MSTFDQLRKTLRRSRYRWSLSTSEERQRVLEYVALHDGKEVDWNEFAQAVEMHPARLGPLLRQFIDRDFVLQPDSDVFMYRLPTAPPRRKRRER